MGPFQMINAAYIDGEPGMRRHRRREEQSCYLGDARRKSSVIASAAKQSSLSTVKDSIASGLHPSQ
jgi:hypothetical protein